MAKPFFSLAVFLVWFVAFDASAGLRRSRQGAHATACPAPMRIAPPTTGRPLSAAPYRCESRHSIWQNLQRQRPPRNWTRRYRQDNREVDRGKVENLPLVRRRRQLRNFDECRSRHSPGCFPKNVTIGAELLPAHSAPSLSIRMSANQSFRGSFALRPNSVC